MVQSGEEFGHKIAQTGRRNADEDEIESIQIAPALLHVIEADGRQAHDHYQNEHSGQDQTEQSDEAERFVGFLPEKSGQQSKFESP